MTSEFNPAQMLKERPTADLSRLSTRALLFGGVGVAACAAGFFMVDRSQFLQSYLIAYMFWIGLSLGSLGLLMIQHLSGGAWGLVGRRVFEAAMGNLPLMAVLFIPIAMNLETLYLWARPEAANDPILVLKAAYLNANFFYLRAALYFVVWMVLAFTLRKWSKAQDDAAPLGPGPMDRRFRVFSGPGLVLFMLTVTFMSVDWVMSLDPHFYSTIFGVLTVGGQGLSTLAFTILTLQALSGAKPISEVTSAERFHDYGKLMLAFVMLWAYFNVSQLLIIWSANLPEEIPWYIERLQGHWAPWAVFLLVGHFVAPFVLLLSRDLKRHGRMLSRVAFFVLFMRVVDLVWTIGPVFRHESTGHWLDFAMVVGMSLPWLFLFYRNLGSRALLPANDPYFKESVISEGH
ncbi:MAG TPA: hypothetical protein PKW63_01940 [Vicinamibacterales bacterium]|jgi:hypothetical protein|nr:hypothetical protein [Vicinamibacterales bacterium]